jgi:uncharacterized membrane protein YcaP (DUF421 family)
MSDTFFDSWESVLRVLIVTPLAYFAMILFLRVTGKRTLSKMNAFDFIVTVALGSALANVALNDNVSLLEGALVFFLLIFLQLAITWLSARSGGFKRLVTSEPTLLLYKGKLFEKIMKQQRISYEEVMMNVRSKGFASLNEVDAIILETTGDFTIMGKLPQGRAESLATVENYNESRKIEEGRRRMEEDKLRHEDRRKSFEEERFRVEGTKPEGPRPRRDEKRNKPKNQRPRREDQVTEAPGIKKEEPKANPEEPIADDTRPPVRDGQKSAGGQRRRNFRKREGGPAKKSNGDESQTKPDKPETGGEQGENI